MRGFRTKPSFVDGFGCFLPDHAFTPGDVVGRGKYNGTTDPYPDGGPFRIEKKAERGGDRQPQKIKRHHKARIRGCEGPDDTGMGGVAEDAQQDDRDCV